MMAFFFKKNDAAHFDKARSAHHFNASHFIPGAILSWRTGNVPLNECHCKSHSRLERLSLAGGTKGIIQEGIFCPA